MVNVGEQRDTKSVERQREPRHREGRVGDPDVMAFVADAVCGRAGEGACRVDVAGGVDDEALEVDAVVGELARDAGEGAGLVPGRDAHEVESHRKDHRTARPTRFLGDKPC